MKSSTGYQNRMELMNRSQAGSKYTLLGKEGNSDQAVILLRMQGASFDTEAKRHQGRAFTWIERMLTAGPGGGRWAPKKDTVARAALKNLLASNHDLLEATLDRCYSSHAAVSRAYFQVCALKFPVGYLCG